VVGGITAPGNSPYSLTVGSLDGQGTATRSDDVVSDYSSRGPTLYDRVVKPDIAAPGRKIDSLYVPGSTFAKKYPQYLVSGNGQNGLFRLSGTSMATGVVTGAAALVLEANPSLNPLQVRIALQMGATFLPDAGLVGAGAGELNAAASVQLAKQGPGVPGGTRRRDGERGNREFVLPAEPERAPAGHQHLQAGRCGQQLGEQRSRVGHLLEVVQYQQQLPAQV